MKKLLLILAAFSCFAVFAQKSAIESAAIYLRNSEMDDAKKSIDAAAINDETKNDPKMWYYRAAIYDTLYRNPAYASLFDADGVETIFTSCKKCIETDVKDRYADYCDYAIVNSGFATYNKAIEFMQHKDAKNAAKYFQYTLDVVPFDKNNDLKKSNITETNILLSLADLNLKIAYPGEDENGKEITVAAPTKTEAIAGAKANLQKLIDIDYQYPIIYYLMGNMYVTEKDTVQGMKYIELGRSKFPTDKSLITFELDIYLKQGRQDVLLKKLNDALEIDPENVTLTYVRGTVYDKFSSNALLTAKHGRDTSEVLSRKGKVQASPALKTKYANESKYYKNLSDSMFIMSKKFAASAEADYIKVTQLKDDYIDAYYNLGALTNNKTTDIVEKMNSISEPTQAEYDKKWAIMKKEQDAILMVALGYFSKALEFAEVLPDSDKEYKNGTIKSILLSMQQVYANLGDEKKAMEMKKRRMQLD